MANWTPIAINETITEFSQSFYHFIEGDYLAKVKSVTASPENWDYSENNPTLYVDFAVAEGQDGIGKGIRYSAVIFPSKDTPGEMNWNFLGKVLDALNVDPTSIKSMAFPSYAKFAALAKGLSAKLAGVEVGIEIADDSYTPKRLGGQTQIVSRITGFFPAGEWELRSKPRTTPPPVAAAPKAAPAATNGAAPAPAPAALPTIDASADEGDLDEEIKKLFAAAPA